MAGTFTLKSLTFRDGTTVEIPATGVLCVVGGNNVGKSRLLADIRARLSARNPETLILADLAYEVAPPSDVEEWLKGRAVIHSEPGELDKYSAPDGRRPAFGASLYAGFFNDLERNFEHLGGFLLRAVDAAERAQLAASGMPIGQGLRHPLNELFRDGDLEARLSEICQRTFGFPLTLDRVNGEVLLRAGLPGIPSPPLQRPTREYADAVLRLPPMRDQGDGVKNYLGMVLHLMTSQEPVTVIDEPEAFLHPAQARALGRHIGDEVRMRDRQLLTATHDRDFVLGLLESDCPVVFVRLNRVGDESVARALEPNQVKEIWDRPVLRYSNIMQGLFHRVVVVCEGDADCRWYGAVLDVLSRRERLPGEEVLFVPAGGKAQIRSTLEALGSLDVTSFAILDFDGLLDADYVIGLLQSLGGDHKEGGRLARAIASQLQTSEQRKRAKEAGLAGLPAGTATSMAERLVELLRMHGVLVVPVGELESFERSIGGHGPAWVTTALGANRHRDNERAQSLLRPVLASLTG